MSELQINTTQNVKINFTAAGVGERLLAFFIDMLIKTAYYVFLNQAFGAFQFEDSWSQMAVDVLLGLPVVFYTLVQEIFMDGQTLGKKVMGIKVVKIDGYQASLSDYVVRWFFRIVDVYIFGLGFFIMLINKQNQRVGDMAAGTAVISLRNNVNISHTILEELRSDYKPTYPSVIKLSDNDVRIIKETFKIAKKNADYKTLIQLRSKIVDVIGIKDFYGTDMEFIDTIVKDYNYYTQSM
ncbi:MAG TPA: RDD family protein [Mangrovimonas sp.]|nr:RDD family protein [Mangrovimonas sp.]